MTLAEGALDMRSMGDHDPAAPTVVAMRDGALVEFASAVDALSAAIEFQQSMAEANSDRPADTALVFRMGLHLGDLIVDGDDLYGDGVNIAARLEVNAAPIQGSPGGLTFGIASCLSASSP